ncbi:type VII secretion protein EssA [Rummeliibacillus pycnus]|uniref:type VII secretion protein EssA n=1 Tax=Rummeliibacillus pycnus TaxID=101070 RepID=UPI001473506C|nr:type VII secretion protein EssA [Rummeliibacillus pycnus]
MKYKWIGVLIICCAIVFPSLPAQANEDNGQLKIDINRINEDKTKNDSTDNLVEGTDDLFTDDSIKVENYLKHNEQMQEKNTLNSLFQKDYMGNPNTNISTATIQLFQEKLSVTNIQQENSKTESLADRWLFITMITIIIILLCIGLFLSLRKLNVGESNG